MYPCRKKPRKGDTEGTRKRDRGGGGEGGCQLYLFPVDKTLRSLPLSSSPHTYVSLFVTRSEDARKKTMTQKIDRGFKQKHNGR